MKLNKTKIVATVGPASSSKPILKKLISSGVDVFRINFSHSSYAETKKIVDDIRSLNSELKVHVSILGDLQGPKIRIGQVEQGVELKKGDVLSFTTTDPDYIGDKRKVSINYSSFPSDVSKNEKILINDGKLILKVIKTNKKDCVEAKVIQGGSLNSNKGVNLPNTKISMPALTPKDKEDALFSIKNKFDWIALSFVRSSQDLIDLKKLMSENTDRKIPIISKIEKPEAIENIDKIIAYSDGLMVARGDLGVEVPAQEVPLIQKRLVLLAKTARIPIIIATQMMESMIDSLTPTRAEVNDVANSVMDGADAVMLSGETSVGKYPVEVINNMSDILTAVENSELIEVPHTPPNIRTKRFITKSICYHAAHLANDIEARAICTLTNSGYTAYQISAWRPQAHVLVYTSNRRILNQLNLLWGVKAFYYNNLNSTDKTVEEINQIALDKGYVEKEDMLVNLTAMPIETKGMVNTLRVSVI